MLYLCLNLYCTGKRGKKKPFFLCVSDTLRLVFTLPCGYHQQQRRKTEFLSFCPVIAVFPQLRRKSEICLSFFFCVCVSMCIAVGTALLLPLSTQSTLENPHFTVKPAFFQGAVAFSLGRKLVAAGSSQSPAYVPFTFTFFLLLSSSDT